MFHVGQKVVCINERMNGGGARWSGYLYPTEGKVYTIRDIFPGNKGAPLLLLSEIRNKCCHTVSGFIEPGLNADHFRPIVERKTDISIFTAMLNPAPSKVTEHVR